MRRPTRPHQGQWKKGQSGNPLGRPKFCNEARDLARKHAAEAIATLVEVMQAGESHAVRISAANSLLDRGYGRPVQGVTVMLEEIGGTLSDKGRVIADGMLSGRITPAEASQLLAGLASLLKIVEADELIRRIERLEGNGKS